MRVKRVAGIRVHRSAAAIGRLLSGMKPRWLGGMLTGLLARIIFRLGYMPFYSTFIDGVTITCGYGIDGHIGCFWLPLDPEWVRRRRGRKRNRSSARSFHDARP
jgi:hypothetical protein